MPQSKVSIIKCQDYTQTQVETAVSALLDHLGGIAKFVKPTQKVLIKPNLLTGSPPEKAAATHPEIVRAVIKLVKKAGGIPLVGDSPGFETPRHAAEGSGILKVVEEEGATKAKEWIENIVRDVEVGETYEGKVLQIITDRNKGNELGAIVELLPGKDGMVHISQVSHQRIDKISSVINVGDTVKVKVMEVDREKNRISLSMKELLPKPKFDNKDRGTSFPAKPKPAGKPRFFKKK